MIKIKKGLNLPIEGSPEQKIHQGPSISKVALIGDDIVGMKPTMEVQVGDHVQAGQLLYRDKKTEGVNYTAPASGEVIEINRGARRAFQSVVIRVEGEGHVNFDSYKGSDLSSYDEKGVRALLLESGMWPSLRRRPYSKVARPDETPSSIFVTAMDSNPLAADPAIIIQENEAAFTRGLKVLSKLAPKVFLCSEAKAPVPGNGIEGVTKAKFSGPHPSGLPGTHIHYMDPVGEKKFVWHINYQEVIAIGKLLETGQLYFDRVVSIAGPVARNPRLVKTRAGASIDDLIKGETFEAEEVRPVSGSVLSGREARGPFAYLGRFHHQVSLLKEGRKREFLGWHSPGLDKFSVKPIYISALMNKSYDMTTNKNGSLRSIVPIGSYEKVMPMDILPTYLLRTIMAHNTDMAVKLGAL
ncbi:MAG: Na(+)-translocating NADH-quinone reductase subunit A, partial [Bacteriovoracaceae bacterium]